MSTELMVLSVFGGCLLLLVGKIVFDMFFGEGRRGSGKSPVPARNRSGGDIGEDGQELNLRR